MPIMAAAGTIKHGDIDDARHLHMPHLTPTKPAARGNRGGPHDGAPNVDPQGRIDSLCAHLGTRAPGLAGREAEQRARVRHLEPAPAGAT